MIILGVDPGLTTGIAVIEYKNGKQALKLWEDLHAKGTSLSERIHNVANKVKGVLDKFNPDVIAKEIHYHEKSHGGWSREKLNKGDLQKNQMTCGAIGYVLQDYISRAQVDGKNIYYYEVNTSNPKIISGRFPRVVLKEKAQAMVLDRFGVKVSLNSADAIAFIEYALQELRYEQSEQTTRKIPPDYALDAF